MQRFIGSALRRLDLYRRINLVSPLKIGDATFSIPLVAGLRSRVSELWMVDVLKAVLPRREGAFIDIGVNLGQTLLKLRSVAPDRPYIGFEPNPTCVAYLERLVAANGFEQVTIVPAGVSDRPALLALQIYGNADDPSASVLEDFRGEAKVRDTKIVSLMSLAEFERLLPDQIAAIKIDVEGAELEVLTTLSPLIARTQPFVLLEVLPAYDAENRRRIERQEAIEVLLASLGYRIFRILRTPQGRFDRIEPVASFGIHGDLDLCDYLLVPPGSEEAIADIAAS